MFWFGSVYILSVFCLFNFSLVSVDFLFLFVYKIIYHIKIVFILVRFGLYTIDFWFIQFYTKKLKLYLSFITFFNIILYD